MEKSTIYFGKEAEDAIRDYVNSDNYDERQKIYLEKIYPVFCKLVENIIFKYNFLNLTNNYEDLHQEVVSHLYLNLDKFNPMLGFKSYSYFGTATKRYLIQKSIDKNFENKNIDDIYDREKGEINDDVLKNAIIGQDEKKIEEDKEFISILTKHFEKRKPKDEKEAKIIEAIIYFLKNYEGINIANKKHWYVLLREYSGLDTKTITKTMSEITKEYNKIKKQYINYEL